MSFLVPVKSSRRELNPALNQNMWRAIENQSTNDLRYWLRQGADANALHDGAPPITVVTEYGNETMVELLLQHGALVNATDTEGDTALAIAARDYVANIAELLLLYGADASIPDGNGNPIIYTTQDPYIVELLMQRGVTIDFIRPTPTIAEVTPGTTLITFKETNIIGFRPHSVVFFCVNEELCYRAASSGDDPTRYKHTANVRMPLSL